MKAGGEQKDVEGSLCSFVDDHIVHGIELRRAQNVRMLLFGKNLRARARELSLTDAEVARRAGLNERRYGFYVTGEREPDLATLVRIASVLQTSVDCLLSDEDDHSETQDRESAELLSALASLDEHHRSLLLRTAETFVAHMRMAANSDPKRGKKKSAKTSR